MFFNMSNEAVRWLAITLVSDSILSDWVRFIMFEICCSIETTLFSECQFQDDIVSSNASVDLKSRSRTKRSRRRKKNKDIRAEYKIQCKDLRR